MYPERTIPEGYLACYAGLFPTVEMLFRHRALVQSFYQERNFYREVKEVEKGRGIGSSGILL
jgi:hypothetical protein